VRLRGTVVKGFGRGSKELGVPTANLDPEALGSSLDGVQPGVYFGWASVGASGEVYKMVMSIGWCVWRARGEGGGGWPPHYRLADTRHTTRSLTHVSPPSPLPPLFSHAQEPLLREQVEDGRAPPASLLPRGLLWAGAAPVCHGLPAPRAQLHIARRAHRGDQVRHRHGEGGARRGGTEEAGGGRGPPAPGMSERGDGGAGRDNFWRGTRERDLCDTLPRTCSAQRIQTYL
jgi:hypothetical protein